MSGVPVQSTRRDTGMCTKAVAAFYCCQCWRLSFPQKSQLAYCGCLIFNTTEWLLLPPLLTHLWIEIWDLQNAWQGIWIRDTKTFIIPKVKVWCTWQQCFTYRTAHNNAWQKLGYSVTVILAFAGPDCWWDSGFMDPISNRRKWVRFVALELWEQINKMLIREVQL